MPLVVDASVLVAELLRQRGRALFAHPLLDLAIAGYAWAEAGHEMQRRGLALEQQGRLPSGGGDELAGQAMTFVSRCVQPVGAARYTDREAEARRRIPRDPDDWHTVALALALDAAIWTQDHDFFGCGVATWTTDTLLAHLRALEPGEP